MRTRSGDKKKLFSNEVSKIRRGEFRTIRGVKYFSRLIIREDLRLLQAAAGACVCPRRDAGAAARARRSPRAEPSTGVVDGPQGGEAREGDASGGCRRCE